MGQNMQDHRKQQGASARKNVGSQKTMDQALMRTEYMDSFLPPFSYKMIVRTIQKHAYHPLKGTSADAATLKSFYLAPKWAKNLPNPPQPSKQPRDQQRTSTAPHNPERTGQQANKHQSVSPSDSLEDNQELFESTTSYRSDFVAHPVQPRIRTQTPVHSSHKGLISDPTQDQEKLFSTTQADFTAHKCQRIKPILPTMQNYEKSTEPFLSTTTMKEDFKAWSVPRRLPIIPKQELNWLKKYTSRKRDSTKSCRNNQTTSSLRPRETAACNVVQSPQTPAGTEVISCFQCISDSNEESTTFWTASVGRGVTQANGEVCEEPCQNQKAINSMVSRKAYCSPETRKVKKRGAGASARVVSALNTSKS